MKVLQNQHMARLIPIILSAFLVTSAAPLPDELTDLDKYRLKGSVKSVMETKWALADGGENAAREKILFRKFTSFDENGYETGNVLYKDGKEYLLTSFTFGSHGKQDVMKEHHPDGALNLEVNFHYDEKGFRTEAHYLWTETRMIGDLWENTDYYYEIIQNDLFTKALYKNEYRGYCVEEKYLKPDSSLSFKFEMKYDFRGNKLESAYFHGNGHLSWLTKMKYDRYDNLIESNVYKSNRIAVESVYKYQFDEVGNWISRYEERTVHVNLLTAGLERANTVTERQIEYY
jgi:hypothetical protein